MKNIILPLSFILVDLQPSGGSSAQVRRMKSSMSEQPCFGADATHHTHAARGICSSYHGDLHTLVNEIFPYCPFFAMGAWGRTRLLDAYQTLTPEMEDI